MNNFILFTSYLFHRDRQWIISTELKSKMIVGRTTRLAFFIVSTISISKLYTLYEEDIQWMISNTELQTL